MFDQVLAKVDKVVSDQFKMWQAQIAAAKKARGASTGAAEDDAAQSAQQEPEVTISPLPSDLRE